MGEWQQGLFGCFSNCGVCIITMLCPCLTMGNVGEALGENKLLYCIGTFIPILDIFLIVTGRGKLREKQGIEGGLVEDILLGLCCTGCVLCQMGSEAKAISGGMAADQTIERC